MSEQSYFQEALGDFVRNFAYGDEIRKLVKRGYDADRIIREMQYPLSRASIEKMVQKAEAEIAAGQDDAGGSA